MAPEQHQHEVGEGRIIDALNIHYIHRVLLLSSSSISMLESFACHSSLFSKKWSSWSTQHMHAGVCNDWDRDCVTTSYHDHRAFNHRLYQWTELLVQLSWSHRVGISWEYLKALSLSVLYLSTKFHDVQIVLITDLHLCFCLLQKNRVCLLSFTVLNLTYLLTSLHYAALTMIYACQLITPCCSSIEVRMILAQCNQRLNQSQSRFSPPPACLMWFLSQVMGGRKVWELS